MSGLSLWLKADDGIIATGNEVDVWADMSGNANDLWAPSTTGRPLTATATFGDGTYDVLRFDGVDDVLTLGPVPNIPFQDHTVFFVAARTGGIDYKHGNLVGFDKTGGRGEDGWYYKMTGGQINMESGIGADYGFQLAATNGRQHVRRRGRALFEQRDLGTPHRRRPIDRRGHGGQR